MNKVKKLLSLIFSGIFLNISVIDTNGMDSNGEKKLLRKKKEAALKKKQKLVMTKIFLQLKNRLVHIIAIAKEDMN